MRKQREAEEEKNQKEKENKGLEMVIGVVVMIVMAETMRNSLVEMVTEMVTTRERVKVLMITAMTQEAGAQIGTEIVTMMMADIHPEVVVLKLKILLWKQGWNRNFLSKTLVLVAFALVCYYTNTTYEILL